MNSSAAKVTSSDPDSMRAAAPTARAERDVAGTTLVRSLRVVARSARRAGLIFNTVVDAARGRFER